ncbi:hypothetical protein ACFSUD_03890 [Sulfitobacter aestuarii]|uniref:Uncharacterized protein n=1 Tax=Sulfitobacter aestuarii TaxID=2161676 RepID=A0ABW5TZK6_9RHOB
MMLSAADFEELFPELNRRAVKVSSSGPARRQDDGGASTAPREPRVEPASPALRAGMTLAMMPSFAAVGAASAMLHGYHLMNGK